MKINHKTYEVSQSGKLGTFALVIGIVALIASAAGYFVDSKQFFFSYLTSFVFWLTLGLGGLFFVMLHHLVDAKWSVVLRRIAENLMGVTPIMLVFFLPLTLGMHELFHWTHADAVAADPILQGKEPYLNVPFFGIRAAVYFAVWFYLCIQLYRRSIRQDQQGHSEKLTKSFRRISAPGMLLFAITVTFASFDWMMSLDAHWFSTIFGVYFFSGAFFVALAAIVLMAWFVQRNGKLGSIITTEHYHDLGKFMFAFVVFWAYIAFSQYMLIWYGGIPEETVWYRHRSEHGWLSVSMLLLYGHFLFPFFALITRTSKRRVGWLVAMSAWFLIIHFVDLYWLAFPAMDIGASDSHGFSLHVIDIVLWLGHLSLFAGAALYRINRHSLVPFNDAYFQPALTFENA